ncbi:hypothetical protein BGZ88_004618 [Linnemannia elongata]|nr:hypothetical protein BGZ88_004618 [Linnemannia elongata]
MPRISERRRILDETEEVILVALFTSDDELLELAMMYYAWVEESRYLNRSVVYTKADRSFFDIRYYNMSDDVFRQRFRVTRQAFRTIARMIEQHPIFHRNSSSPQLHPAWQLLVALTRLGHYGSRMAVKLVADEMGMSSGAVTLYTNRVMTALVSLAPDWIRWPDYVQRQEHGLRMGAEGFPRCVGYSVNAQIVCDMDRRIIALDTGHPGSASDSTVFKGMDQYHVPNDYFSPGEYLLADAAYSVSKTCIPPYKAPSSELPDNAAFNFQLACSREY